MFTPFNVIIFVSHIRSTQECMGICLYKLNDANLDNIVSYISAIHLGNGEGETQIKMEKDIYLDRSMGQGGGNRRTENR